MGTELVVFLNAGLTRLTDELDVFTIYERPFRFFKHLSGFPE